VNDARKVAIWGMTLLWIGWTGVAMAAQPATPQKGGNAGDGWPDTRAGAMARRWVEAFAKGDSAMRACLTETMATESIEQRGIPERIKSYKEVRERFGTLELASINKSKPAELEATLIASADMSKHKFVFTVQSKPPYKLISVGRLEQRSGHGHGFGH